MRRTFQGMFVMMMFLLLAAPVYAQGAAPAEHIWAVPIGAGIGMGIAAGLAGMGQGRVAAAVAEALARNPGARPGINLALFLGLAFIESLVLFTFVMIFIRTSW